MKARKIDTTRLARAWTTFDRAAGGFGQIRTEVQYDRYVAIMNSLLDMTGGVQGHKLAGLLDTITALVADYDSIRYAIPATSPREVLRFLMEANNLKQTDLASIVSQGNLSAILAGRRAVSAQLAIRLGERFNLEPSAFLERRKPAAPVSRKRRAPERAAA